MKNGFIFLAFLITLIGCSEVNENIDNSDDIFEQVDLTEIEKYVSPSAYKIAKYVKDNKVRVDIPDTLNVFLKYLKSEEYVKDVEYDETYNVISIFFTDGTDFRILNVFETGEEVKSVPPPVSATQNVSEEYFVIDVANASNEVIQENLNMLYVNAMPNENLLEEEAIHTIDAPVNYKLTETEGLGGLQELDNDDRYGAVLISHTHGVGGGDFIISNIGTAKFLYNALMNKLGELEEVVVKPLQFITDATVIDKQPIVYANYCWSEEASMNYNATGAFIALHPLSQTADNVKDSKRYFTNLFHGRTSKEAYKMLENPHEWFHNIQCEIISTYTYMHGEANMRYFSISTEDPAITDEKITIQGKINGFGNLKHDQCKFKIYYRKGTSIIESPTDNGVESIVLNETDIDDDGNIILDVTRLIKIGVDYTFRIGFEYKDVCYFGESKNFNYTKPDLPGSWVDLGLSVLWSDRNVGAYSPEDYGKYYSWAEVDEKAEYTLKNYKYYNSYKQTYSKFDSEICGTVYDVAHCKWGGGARLPNVEEIDELRTKCTKTEGVCNGVSGTYVTGPNGHSIFLPKGGYRFGAETRYEDETGYFWSGRCLSNYSMQAVVMYDNGLNDFLGCHLGMSVRPVKDK